MRSFRAIIGGLLVTAATILALPTGNVPRSLSSDSLGQTVFARTIPVTFSSKVPPEEHADITQKVHDHHASLADGDPQKAAIRAHVHRGYHSEGSADTTTHATFRYHNTLGTLRGGKQANHIGDAVHLAARSFDDEEFFVRTIPVTFGPHVPADQHAGITQKVHDHHASLADTDPQKAAVRAHVHKGFHTEGSTDPENHATFRYHTTTGTVRGSNAIGNAVHLYPRTIPVTFGPHVPAGEHAAIKKKVEDHHASLADTDPRKAALKAHVHKGFHTEGSADPNDHATFRYHSTTGTVRGSNAIGDAVHLYPRTIPVTFGPHVPAGEHAAIKKKVEDHHASLADTDPRKAALKAHVHKGFHTEGSADPNDHATFRYHSTSGTVRGSNAIGDAVHLYPRRR